MMDDKPRDRQTSRHIDESIRWSEIEVRLRVLFQEFRAELLQDIYERNLDPLKERVDLQDKYCAQHSQELTTVHTLLNEVVDAKLIRRMEVAEARLNIIGRATVVTGSIAGTAVVGLIVAILTHQISL